MINEMGENRTNFVEISGTAASKLTFSHRIYGENFYNLELSSERISGYCDVVRVVLSERILCGRNIEEGEFLKIEGQVRTYNEQVDGRSRLNIVVFAREMELCQEETYHVNNVYLEGFVCRIPVRRTSPMGREICDIMLAVNRMYNKSDYIPCIAWGRNAVYSENFTVGTGLAVEGRLQSREYRKKLEDGSFITKTAYEVSVLKIEEQDF